MKQTRQLVAVEGFGSGHRAAAYARRDLTANTDYDDVVVFSFQDAINKPEELAEMIHRRNVVAHSAGSLAISRAMAEYPDARPESMLLVASPIPTDPARLILRASNVFQGELRDSSHSREDARLNIIHTLAMGGELGRHARTHFGAIPAISKFDSFEFGNELIEEDIPVRMAAMTRDEFFLRSSQEFYDGFYGRKPELEVVSIEGRHCRFAQRPSRVMGEIAIASVIEYLPHPDRDKPSRSLWPEPEPLSA